MSLSKQNDQDAGLVDVDRSLRLVASLPAPAGIEERVKAGLRVAPIATGVIGWPLTPLRASWAEASYMRAAAAAAIVMVVAGGGWGVFARFGPAPIPAAEAVQQRIHEGGGLSPAGAMRTPKTVEGPAIAIPKTVRQETEADRVSAQQHLSNIKRKKKVNRPSVPVAAVR